MKKIVNFLLVLNNGSNYQMPIVWRTVLPASITKSAGRFTNISCEKLIIIKTKKDSLN